MYINMDRDLRTLDIMTEKELQILKTKSVCVVGAGGLGGYVIEMLARIGMGTIRVVDKDIFDESNLNRQMLSTEQNLGVKKITEAKERISIINSNIKFEGIGEELTEENAVDILKDVDIVVDCVDNLRARYAMEYACEKLNIVLVHGAVGAWQGQVSTVFPQDKSISKIYGDNYSDEIEPIGTAAFLPATIASYQVSECVKVLLDKGEVLRRKVLYIDILNNQNYIVDLDEKPEDI